jgi:hypothetical protein
MQLESDIGNRCGTLLRGDSYAGINLVLVGQCGQDGQVLGRHENLDAARNTGALVAWYRCIYAPSHGRGA